MIVKKIGEVERGKVVRILGQFWIVVEHDGDGTLLLAKRIYCERAFDDDGCNDYSESAVRKYLNIALGERQFGITDNPDFLPYELDLTADDGTTYGKCKDKIFLLNDEIYRRNRDVIEPIPYWWWTATARSTIADRSLSVRQVGKDGALDSVYAFAEEGGVRPACYLRSDTPVLVYSCDNEEALC